MEATKVKEIKMVDLQGQYLRIKNEIDAAYSRGPDVHGFYSEAAGKSNLTGIKS